jgi:hypothetical protein
MPVIMSNPVKENRCGKFSIGETFLDEEPYLVMKIMGKCIIVETVNRFMTKSIDYYAYSSEFGIVENPSAPPFYDIIIHRDENGEKIEFKKTEDCYNKNVLRKITY